MPKLPPSSDRLISRLCEAYAWDDGLPIAHQLVKAYERERGDDTGDGGYGERVLNVAALLAQPDEPIPWRCDRLAADGYLTVLAGRGGAGKSWLSLALACGVARGEEAAGIPCRPGRALIFDAENGPKLIARRLRAAGVLPDLAVQPVDAGGLRIGEDLDWFRQTIEDQRADLVVFDSLRVLASGAKESDSGEMEPLITRLKLIARETGAAVLLIHHAGKGESSAAYRGSSAILDQTDLLFTFGRVPGDPEGRYRRKVTALKCRIDEEPAPRWVAIRPDRGRGLVLIDAAEPYEGDEAGRPRDAHREGVIDALGDLARSGRSIAKALGISEPTARRLLHDLAAEGLARRTADGWVRQPPAPKGETHVTHLPGDGGEELNTGASPVAPKGDDAGDAPRLGDLILTPGGAEKIRASVNGEWLDDR